MEEGHQQMDGKRMVRVRVGVRGYLLSSEINPGVQHPPRLLCQCEDVYIRSRLAVKADTFL